MRVEHHQRRLGGLYLVIATAYEPVSRLGLGPGSSIDEPKCSHSAPDTRVHNLAVETHSGKSRWLTVAQATFILLPLARCLSRRKLSSQGASGSQVEY